jgi:hypothetical protein
MTGDDDSAIPSTQFCVACMLFDVACMFVVPRQIARREMGMPNPVAVEISPKWVSLINSPLMWLVWALQGVALTFAPLFLYWSGKGLFVPAEQRIVMPLCFVVIFLEGFFFCSLANHVIGQVRRATQRRGA